MGLKEQIEKMGLALVFSEKSYSVFNPITGEAVLSDEDPVELLKDLKNLISPLDEIGGK